MLAIKQLKNEKGMAVIEMIPIIIIVLILLSFSFGFFGVVHTGILNSMAARNYAFETFNHRADLRYFRAADSVAPDDENEREKAYHEQNFRMHGIASETRAKGADEPFVTTREITFGWDVTETELVSAESQTYHKDEVQRVRDGFRYTNDGVNPVWIQSSYGICLNMKCGEN